MLANIIRLMSGLAKAHLASLQHGLQKPLLRLCKEDKSLPSVMLSLCDLDIDNAVLAEEICLMANYIVAELEMPAPKFMSLLTRSCLA